MKIKEFSGKLDLKLLTEDVPEIAEVKNGYICDLLSWVMAKGEEGMAWITVQTHLNVVAVACLHDFACIIVPENIEVPQATIDKANEEGMAIYSAAKTAYELACEMAALGIKK